MQGFKNTVVTSIEELPKKTTTVIYQVRLQFAVMIVHRHGRKMNLLGKFSFMLKTTLIKVSVF
jgi:hypothetical protein